MMKQRRTRPLHEMLRREFHGFIVSQQWPPGFRLPFETDLAAEYGVSRMTMNKVLAQLTREGYLVRQRKLGTMVAQPRAQSAVMDISDIEAEVTALGQPYRFTLLSRTIRLPLPEERLRARISESDKAQVLALSGLHHAGDVPFCMEARIINPAAAPAALRADFSREAPGKWLRKEIPWSSAEHTIRAMNATVPVARNLELALGEACLEIIRRTEIADQWVTLAAQTYPGDRHQLVSRFTPSGAAG